MLNTKDSTRNMILAILSDGQQRSVRKILSQLQAVYGKKVTYQAVHKIIGQLCREGVLSRFGKEYQINKGWLTGLCSFVCKIGSSEGIPKVENTANVLRFKNIMEADNFMIKLEKEFAHTTMKKGKICIQYRHSWWPLVYAKGDYIVDIKSAPNKLYGLCRGDTPTDKWCADFYRKIGMKVKTGVDLSSSNSVFGDITVEVFVPPSISKQIDKIFKSVKDPADFDTYSFIQNILKKKVDIYAIVIKSKTISERVRERVLERFGEV